jgi:hypothetical protein
MNEKVPYRPTPTDLDWAETALDLMADGGVLVYPSSGLMYQFDHRARTITLVNPHPRMRALHRRSCAVFGAFGYKVLPTSIDG